VNLEGIVESEEDRDKRYADELGQLRRDAEAAGGTRLGEATPEEKVRMRILTELSEPREIRRALKRARVLNVPPRVPAVCGVKTPELHERRALLKGAAIHARIFNSLLAHGQTETPGIRKLVVAESSIKFPEKKVCERCGKKFVPICGGKRTDKFCSPVCEHAGQERTLYRLKRARNLLRHADYVAQEEQAFPDEDHHDENHAEIKKDFARLIVAGR